jgi:hypothetical protein
MERGESLDAWVERCGGDLGIVTSLQLLLNLCLLWPAGAAALTFP